MSRGLAIAGMVGWLCLIGVTVPSCTALREPYQVVQKADEPNDVKVAQEVGILLGDFQIYQEAAVAIGKNDTLDASARLKVVDSARAVKPAMDDLSEGLKQYQAVKAALLAGVTPTQKLEVVTANLEGWYRNANQLFQQLKSDVAGGAK